MVKVLGITDEITVCDCCGKTNLKCTVALELDSGEQVHYGRDCAGKAVFGRKSAKNTSIVEYRARANKKLKPLFDLIVETLKTKSIRETVLEVRPVAEKIWWNGGTVGVYGYDSWECVKVEYCGGVESFKKESV